MVAMTDIREALPPAPITGVGCQPTLKLVDGNLGRIGMHGELIVPLTREQADLAFVRHARSVAERINAVVKSPETDSGTWQGALSK